MPRQSRRLSKSKIYHVMERGNEKKAIFLDDEDKQRFMTILSLKNENNGYSVYAYCLMDNHVHLVIDERQDSVSRIMKSINISYAGYFNRKYSRVGHLFQDRFKSEPVEDDRYLLAVIRYIHQNPVKAGIVKHAKNYKWSSYCEYLGENDEQGKIIDRKYILEMFHSDEEKAVKLFVEFMGKQDKNQFLDIEEEEINHSEALKIIHDILKEYQLTPENLKDYNDIMIRNKIVCEIRERTKLSQRKMAKVLNMDKSAINRIVR
jgi:putative transposase